MYLGCQCSSARCSRLLSERLTLFGIFSAEIISVSSLINHIGVLCVEAALNSCPCPVKLRPSLVPVRLQRPLFADGIRPLEDPVLPRCQTAADLGLHRLA